MEDPPGEKIPEPEEAQPLSDELLPDREKILLELYAECDAEKAKAMSKEARAGMDPPAGANLVYAELDIASMHSILNLLRSQYGPLFVGQGVFVDLGSGVGKAAVAAALLHPFQKVVGIEYLAPLHAVASDVQGKFAAAAATVLEEGKTPPEVSFMTGDFVAEVAGSLEPIAAECKVALAVATCYLEPQLKAMAKFAAKMPENSIFITFGQQLPLSMESGEDWVSLNVESMEMSWGPSTCFIYKKQAPMVQDEIEEEESPLPPKPKA